MADNLNLFDQGGLLGPAGGGFGGLLDPRAQAMLGAAQVLGQAGGPSRMPISTGAALSNALAAGVGGYRQAQAAGMQQQMARMQLDKARREAEFGGKTPASVLEYKFAKDNGYTGSYADFIASHTRTNVPSAVQEWKYFSQLSPEDKERYLTMKRAYRYEDLGGSVVRLPQTPGGVTETLTKTVPPQDQPELKGAQAGAQEAARLQVRKPEMFNKASQAWGALGGQHEIVNNDIGRALSFAEKMGTTGIPGSLLKGIPGTPAHDLSNLLDTIKANIGFDKLQAMRAASPTGGALGQVSERENKLLQMVFGSLEQSQTKKQLITNLKRLKTTIAQSRQRLRKAFMQQFGKEPPAWSAAAPVAADGAGGGWKIERVGD